MGERRTALILVLILCSVLVTLPNIGMVKGTFTGDIHGNTYINEDGSIEPSDSPIQRNGNIFTLTADLNGMHLRILRSNVIFDGNGYTLYQNIDLRHVTNVTVKNLLITNRGGNGISIDHASNNTIQNNTIWGGCGGYSQGYMLAAINILFGYSNIIVGNNITGNVIGLIIPFQTTTLIYNNNFVDNYLDVNQYHPSNAIFDNGKVGNYWSKYNGTDEDGNKIGDTPHIIDENNTDFCPLMAPTTIFDADIYVQTFDVGTWEWIQYNVDVVSNSTVSDFSFNHESALIRFEVEGEYGTTGFCRVTLPKAMLYTEGDWAVLVDGASVSPTLNEDTNTTHLYFTYNHSTKTVEIIGTDVIPEFPSWIILPLFLAATSFSIIIRKRTKIN